MNRSKSYTWAAIVAGVLFILMAMLQLVTYPTVFLYILTLGYLIIAIALFIRKRNILIVIGGIIASLATAVFTLNGITVVFQYPHIVNILTALLNLTNIAGIVLFTVIAACSKTPEKRTKVKKLWFLPAVLMIISDVLMLVFPRIFGWGMMASLANLLGYAIVFIAFLFAGMWLCLGSDHVVAPAYTPAYSPAGAPSYAPPAQAPASVPEELKIYIDLVNSGAITVEEYEAKKKQLMGQ